MGINYKKMLGITLAGLMAVAPMVASASGNSMGMTKSIEATKSTEALETGAGDIGSELSDEAMTKSIESTKIVEFAKKK